MNDDSRRSLCAIIIAISFYMIGCATEGLKIENTDNEVLSDTGDYAVVAIRNLSDVAMPAMGLRHSKIEQGQVLKLGERMQWIDGKVHTDWQKATLNSRVLGLGDPMLSDVYYGIQTAAGVGDAVRFSANDREIGVVYWVDSRVGLVVEPAGSPVYVLERSLSKDDALLLEKQLADMKFDPGIVDGVVDASTRRALGFYLDYLGLPYRFKTPVVSDRLFESVTGRRPREQ